MALSHPRFGSVIRRQWAWLLAGWFGLAVLEAGAARSAPLPPGYSATDAADQFVGRVPNRQHL